MRVIGFDPGLRHTGWGVVDVVGSRLTHVANGVCTTIAARNGGDLALRLVRLHQEIERVVLEYRPDQAAVEHTFVNKVLADHYGIPFTRGDSSNWLRIEDADRYGRKRFERGTQRHYGPSRSRTCTCR